MMTLRWWHVPILLLVAWAVLVIVDIAAVSLLGTPAKGTFAKVELGIERPGPVRAVLLRQQVAWNAGDLAGFMDGYWHDDNLEFIAGDKVTRGWQATFDRYKQRYQADGKEMGRLEFSDLVVKPNGEQANVTGRWKLTMSDGKRPAGGFTLEFREFAEGWKIVRDTTTSDTP